MSQEHYRIWRPEELQANWEARTKLPDNILKDVNTMLFSRYRPGQPIVIHSYEFRGITKELANIYFTQDCWIKAGWDVKIASFDSQRDGETMTITFTPLEIRRG